MNGTLFLAGLSALGGAERLSVAEAVGAGHYPFEEARQDGYLSVSMEPKLSPFDMALRCSSRALEEAALSPQSLDALFYGSIHRHGQPRFWSPASGLQNKLGIPANIPSIAMQQGCNSLTQALLLASGQIRTHGANDHILLVGADCFSGSGFDRWTSDYGLVYGDAAAAVVASGQDGFARILHLAIDGVPALEEMHRDEEFQAENPQSWQNEYNIRRTKKAFLQRYGREGFVNPLQQALARLRTGLETNPEWTGKADWLFTPFVGNRIRLETYEGAFEGVATNTSWDLGRTLGHTGTVDAWIALDHIRNSGFVSKGSRVLIVTAGVGFSAGLILLEFN